MLLANLALAIKREKDGIIDSTINQKGNKNRYMTNMNELVGYLNSPFEEYMDADTLTEKHIALYAAYLILSFHTECRTKKAVGSQARILFHEK